ncbi:hypothetical protein [Micromonospora sp. WMMD964]|uniref:hypothetical protein n=1 Tax=Micromonospora sp. WMMD964 TaxID=3016091 RepID=UPI00249CA69E|nr:hypothetical protein [Micromonospora sp. WMMD964]WFF01558.1 hypothetical protein O7616_01850 [Micromonospora sp. WMMD964]
MSTFDVEVISDPINLLANLAYDFDSPLCKASPAYDTQIVKPALLFADRVNLVSSRSTLHHFVGIEASYFAKNPDEQIKAFIHLSTGKYPRLLQMLGLTLKDLGEAAEAENIIAAMAASKSGRETLDLYRLLVVPFWDKHISEVEALADAYLSLWQERHDSLIAPEVRQAIDRGVVTIQAWGGKHPEVDQILTPADEFLGESVGAMIQRLQDPARLALLDTQLAGSTNGDSQGAGSGPPFIANAVLSRLTGLEDLPITEVLGLREDLKTHLPYFRSEIVRLSDELANTDSSREASALLDRHWHREILPALEEIRREVAGARYPRRLLDAVTADPGTIASSAGALTLAVGGLAAGLSALLPAAAIAAYPFLKANSDRLQRLDQAKANKLFFLYAVQERAGNVM